METFFQVFKFVLVLLPAKMLAKEIAVDLSSQPLTLQIQLMLKLSEL